MPLQNILKTKVSYFIHNLKLQLFLAYDNNYKCEE